MGRLCSHRLGRSEALLGAYPNCFRQGGARRVGCHPGSRRSLGCGAERAFLRPSDRGLSGTETRSLGLYAGQVRASGDLPGAPEHGGSVPGNILSFRRQERSRGCWVATGSTAPPSTPVAGTAPGYAGDAFVAALDRIPPASGGRSHSPEKPADELLENLFSATTTVV